MIRNGSLRGRDGGDTESSYHFLTNSEVFQRGRKSYIPAGGWNTKSLRGKNGKALVNDLIRFQRQVRARSTARIALMMGKRMRRIIQKVVAGSKHISTSSMNNGGQRWVYRKKAVEDEREAWFETISDVMETEDEELEDDLFLEYQATSKELAGGFSKLLGFSLVGAFIRGLIKVAKTIAKAVLRINTTTTKQLERLVSETIQPPQDTTSTPQPSDDPFQPSDPFQPTDGVGDATVMDVDVATMLEENGEDLLTSRVATIARTESSVIVDASASNCYMESGRVLTVQVVGCQAIEPNIPEYEGVPTCNITGVPAEDADKLEFHPNHTGYIVPETFADDTTDAGVEFSEIDTQEE
jgi:hypothetical protein